MEAGAATDATRRPDGGPGTSLRFAEVARLLAAAARRHGLSPPGFRSPPRVTGVPRTIRRWRTGPTVVAVQLRGRPFAAAVADMVEGVVAANHLTGDAAKAARESLLAALPPDLTQ